MFSSLRRTDRRPDQIEGKLYKHLRDMEDKKITIGTWIIFLPHTKSKFNNVIHQHKPFCNISSFMFQSQKQAQNKLPSFICFKKTTSTPTVPQCLQKCWNQIKWILIIYILVLCFTSRMIAAYIPHLLLNKWIATTGFFPKTNPEPSITSMSQKILLYPVT